MIRTTGAGMSSPEYEHALMEPMTEPQRALFLADMMTVRKDDRTAILLGLCLGGLGAHRFYLKDATGILYLIFFWSLVPLFVSLLEVLVGAVSTRVTEYNKREAYRVALRIRATQVSA